MADKFQFILVPTCIPTLHGLIILLSPLLMYSSSHFTAILWPIFDYDNEHCLKPSQMC